MQPYSITENYSIYTKPDGVVIYDTRLEQHKPIFLKGEDAEEFKDILETLALTIKDDAEYEREVETLCERFRKS